VRSSCLYFVTKNKQILFIKYTIITLRIWKLAKKTNFSLGIRISISRMFTSKAMFLETLETLVKNKENFVGTVKELKQH
jgi:hypothetical protein